MVTVIDEQSQNQTESRIAIGQVIDSDEEAGHPPVAARTFACPIPGFLSVFGQPGDCKCPLVGPTLSFSGEPPIMHLRLDCTWPD
jgi:hypothetical protein